MVGNNWQALSDYVLNSPSKNGGETFDTLKHQLTDDLNENLIKVQGMILDLQQRTGEASDYDASLYSEIEATLNNIRILEEALSKLNSKVGYLKNLVDGLKVSQQLSEGYQQMVAVKGTTQTITINSNTAINLNQALKNLQASMPPTITF